MYSKKIFLLMLLIKLSLQQCQNQKMKWCINSEYVENGVIVNKASCKTRPCIISTCPFGEMNEKMECVKMPVDFSEILTLYKLRSGEPVKSYKTFAEVFQVVNYKDKFIHLKEHNNCTTPTFVTIEGPKVGQFLEDGSFFLKPNTILPPEEYIVKFMISNNSGILTPKLKIKFAKDAEVNELDQYMDLVVNYVMFASLFFMLLVLGVYILCKELRTTAGLVFMTYIATLAVTFLIVPVRELTLRNRNMGSTFCYIINPLIHFFTISAYMWMTIMGIDIWWTLRNMFYNRRLGNPKDVKYTKYAWYCVIAWLPPLLYVIIEIYLDEYTEIKGPLFKTCSVCSNKWYLAGPTLALQLMNFVPFVLIIFNILRIRKSNLKHLSSADSNSTGSKQNALLCIKISITMGINWSLDMMLYIFDDHLPDWLKYTLQMLNASFGLILFLAYIFKTDVLLKIFKRLSINNNVTMSLERRLSRKHKTNSRKMSLQSDSNSATVLQAVEFHPENKKSSS